MQNEKYNSIEVESRVKFGYVVTDNAGKGVAYYTPSLLPYTPLVPSFPHNQTKLGQLCGNCLALHTEYGRQVGLIAVSSTELLYQPSVKGSINDNNVTYSRVTKTL